MSPDMTALLAGTALAVGSLAFVLYPLFFGASDRRQRAARDHESDDASAIRALREIEFDRATGKLSETDYAELKRTYSERALRELRQRGAMKMDVPPLDAIEARVRDYRLTHRECPTCGVRPEPEAVYCSTCGHYLPATCPRCSAEITESGAAFCSSCGATLAPARSGALA